MKVFTNINEINGLIKHAVVTIGSFDGVHAGHKAILQRLNRIAKETQGESTLISFNPHPRKVLYPEQTDLRLISSTEEKIELLANTGLQNLIIIPFTLSFSKISSAEFVKQFLVDKLKSKVIVVGPNHHFGHNRTGDFTYLHKLGIQLGFQVEEISILDIENEIISSTKIRKALFEGNIQKANAYLDNQYFIKGAISFCTKIMEGHSVETYKMHCTDTEKLLPPDGFYATRILYGNHSEKAVGMIRNTNTTHPEVLFVPVTPLPLNDCPTGNLLFYKRLMPFDSNGSKTMIRQMHDATEAVNELIY